MSSGLGGKRFVASYSGGKDSVLAVYRAVNAGLRPMGLMTTYNMDSKRSWFHGMDEGVLQRAAESMGMPLTLIRTSGASYAESFESALLEAKAGGAEVCVFGDIDIEGHLDWCSERCVNTGLVPFFPLLGAQRRDVAYEFADAGFSAIIKTVDTSRLPGSVLGRIISRGVLDEIESSGADICGENGEYHTFVFDGPLFSRTVPFEVKETVDWETYKILHIV